MNNLVQVLSPLPIDLDIFSLKLSILILGKQFEAKQAWDSFQTLCLLDNRWTLAGLRGKRLQTQTPPPIFTAKWPCWRRYFWLRYRIIPGCHYKCDRFFRRVIVRGESGDVLPLFMPVVILDYSHVVRLLSGERSFSYPRIFANPNFTIWSTKSVLFTLSWYLIPICFASALKSAIEIFL